MTTFSSSSSAPSYGSAEKTSSAAPATLPERTASASAASSTSSPRAALTIRTPSRIFAIASAPTNPRVSSVSGRCSVRKSAAAKTSSDGLGMLDAELAEALGRDERVVADDAHAEPERPPRDLAADPAEAEHAERLVGELDPAPARALPAALLQRRVRLRDVAGERDEQPDRVLGGRDDGRVGRVRDDDPPPRRRVDVDVVDADAGAADHLQPLGALDQVGGQLRRRADDDRVVAADDLLERRVGVLVDLEARAQQLDAGVRDRLADEDSQTVVPSA